MALPLVVLRNPYLEASKIELGMIARIACRYEKYDMRIVEKFPMFKDLEESATIGSFSWLLMKSKQRLNFAPVLRNFAGYNVTPGDIARDYLHVKYPNPLRCRRAQWLDIKRPRYAPLYAVPGQYLNAVYIDIRAAFWQILRIVGWDVDYLPGQFMGKRSSMDDFPFPAHKLARNCLVTAGLVTPSQVWSFEGQKLCSVKNGNPLANGIMYSCIHDILNGVALSAIKAGAVYAHTDGYICRETDALNVQTAIAEWGLSSSIKKSGNAKIYTVGVYDIPPYKAKRPLPKPHMMDKIDRSIDHEWLRKAFLHHALLTPPYQHE